MDAFIRILVVVIGSVISFTSHSIALEKSVILLPPQADGFSETEIYLLEGALVEGLSANVVVYSGQDVRDTIQKSFAETECSVEKCMNNLAIEYNAELVADFTLVRKEDVLLISLRIENVVTSRNLLTRVITCERCDATQLVKKAKSVAFHAGRELKSSFKTDNRIQQGRPSVVIDNHINSINNLLDSY